LYIHVLRLQVKRRGSAREGQAGDRLKLTFSTMTPVVSGTVTFAFTDIEASTRRWERNFSVMEAAVRRHDALVRAAIVDRGGYVFKALGDAFCAAFSRAEDAVAAMLDVQRLLAAEDFSELDGLPVRAAIHTGTAHERDGDYFGPTVNRVARLLAIGHGGQILLSAATAALVDGRLPPKTRLRDLGQHRLRDLARPERVYGLSAPDLPVDLPPLRSLAALATNLPLQLTSFVGRETELAEIESLIKKHRLVTLVGSAGVGKTRAMLQVAANQLDDWDDGVWFVELAPLSSGDHITSAIAQAMGIALESDSLQSLVKALSAKQVLLLVDNCEHLVDPAARAIATLLAGCHKLSVLASSRQALDVDGEQVYRLPSLAVPEEDRAESLQAADAMECAAIMLFVDRAAAVEKRFALTDGNAPAIAEICRRLDGIPLAIELAASRMSILSLSQLSKMLDERFRLLAQKKGDRLPRQQTLRALIDWSFDLLSEDERAVFRRLSVFAGGWRLEAAVAACSDESIDSWQVFELLSSLVAKSLVVAEPRDDEHRYHMLNSIREYSRDRLVEANEAGAVQARHGRYYADVLPGLTHLVESLEDVQWQYALAPELANLRATLNWAIVARSDAVAGLNLLAHFEWPELVTTPQEAVGWFEAAAALIDAPVNDLIRARILRHLVRLEWLVGRPISEREKTALGAVAVARKSEDPNEIARALANLGGCYRDAGRFDEAESTFAQAYQVPESLSAITLNHVLRNWAVTNLQHGDLDAARRRFTEVAQQERPGSEAHASALLNLGELEFAIGNVQAARDAAGEARETLARLRAAPLALVICNLAAYALAVDDLADARELLREALHLLKKSGARWMIPALEHHALLGTLQGDHERAAALLGFTEVHYAQSGRRERTEQQGYERLISLLSQTYDQEELTRRRNQGARLQDDQALEHAAAISRSAKPLSSHA
jgi:predicted ATPase/class 3 adenylate cyclase